MFLSPFAFPLSFLISFITPTLTMDNPRIISEQIFGSSKKIQFIGMSPMESLLNAVNCADRIDTSENSSHSSNNSSPRTMSIESILDTDYPKPSPSPRQPTAISKPVNTFEPEKRRWMHSSEDVPATHERSNKVRRMASSPPQRMTTLTCLHAAVAQKSYGSEKRFLCPPPVVTIQGESATHPLVSMAVMCENGDRFLEQKILLDETKNGSFKYLHVAGTAKAKQFHLRVSLAHGAPAHNGNGSSPSSSTSSNHINKPTSPPPPSQPYVTFFSCPISIISKPSKKTSKARNVSSCIVANSSVSLFNRINSQTVRTKYMTTENGQLCAKNSSWAPFDIIVLRQPNKPQQGVDDLASPPTNAPVTYGSEIMLKDTQTGVLSPRMIIRKVDKGYIAPNASGPVSQMQKIALQLMPTSDNNNNESMYLSAKASEDTNTSATWLEFATSKRNADDQEKVDDYLCWTIVGIAKFEYSYIEPALPNNAEWSSSPSPSSPTMSSSMHDNNNNNTSLYQQYNNGNTRHPQLSPPPSPPRRIVPLPLIDDVRYSPHRIELTGQHFHSFEFWIGSQGPLKPLDQTPQSMILDLPPTQDLLVAHHDLLVARSDGSRYLELPLVLKHQQDGNTFSSGKGLACDILPNGDAGQWSVIAMHTSPSSS